jgi:hypothetical protein
MQYQPNIENIQGQQNPAMMQGAEAQRVSTNTPDPQFDLISVAYHALEGAQTYAVYAEDAGRNGDKELAQFFIQAQQNQLACADQAKQLLSRRLGQGTLH